MLLVTVTHHGFNSFLLSATEIVSKTHLATCLTSLSFRFSAQERCSSTAFSLYKRWLFTALFLVTRSIVTISFLKSPDLLQV